MAHNDKVFLLWRLLKQKLQRITNLNIMKNSETNNIQSHSINTVLGEVESLWLERLKKYLSDYKCDYVCSWWLRLEYEYEGITTPKINYILSKLVAKGILKKETTRSYTKFSLNLA